MRSKQIIGFTKQIYLCRGRSEEEVYLAQVSAKDRRDLSDEDIAAIPDGHNLFEFELFDVVNIDMSAPFTSQFVISSYVHESLAMNNRVY